MKTENAKHTPGTVRKAQDLAADLGHLNQGIGDLTALYSAAPELLGVAKDALESLANISPRGWKRPYVSEPELIKQLRAAIAKATNEKS